MRLLSLDLIVPAKTYFDSFLIFGADFSIAAV